MYLIDKPILSIAINLLQIMCYLVLWIYSSNRESNQVFQNNKFSLFSDMFWRQPPHFTGNFPENAIFWTLLPNFKCTYLREILSFLLMFAANWSSDSIFLELKIITPHSQWFPGKWRKMSFLPTISVFLRNLLIGVLYDSKPRTCLYMEKILQNALHYWNFLTKNSQNISKCRT